MRKKQYFYVFKDNYQYYYFQQIFIKRNNSFLTNQLKFFQNLVVKFLSF